MASGYKESKQRRHIKPEECTDLKIVMGGKTEVGKSKMNVVTENKSDISHGAKYMRYEVYKDTCSRAPEEKKNEEEVTVKQSVKSLKHSFENMGQTNPVQKQQRTTEEQSTQAGEKSFITFLLNQEEKKKNEALKSFEIRVQTNPVQTQEKCWKMSETEQLEQKKQQTQTEQHSAQTGEIVQASISVSSKHRDRSELNEVRCSKAQQENKNDEEEAEKQSKTKRNSLKNFGATFTVKKLEEYFKMSGKEKLDQNKQYAAIEHSTQADSVFNQKRCFRSEERTDPRIVMEGKTGVGKSKMNVVTETKSVISHGAKYMRYEVYKDTCSRAPEEKKNEEEVSVKQSVKSLKHSFENMGQTNPVQTQEKCWKMIETEQLERKKQQTQTEQHSTQTGEIVQASISVSSKHRDRSELNEVRCSKAQQEKINDEEEAEKQSEINRNSFKNLGETFTVKKLEECWKMSGKEKPDQNKQYAVIEHSTQAVSESKQKRYVNPEERTDLRIMMVGETGAGKSSTGNTILRQKRFREEISNECVTKHCEKYEQTVEGRNISVIDTPGLFDTQISEEELKKAIERGIKMSAPGPHAFLLIIRLDVKFTDEEKNSVKWIQKNFGEEATFYTIVLFTRGDQIDKPIEEFLKQNIKFRALVRQCKGGCHVFNNKDEENQSQVTELLEKIDRMVKENGGDYYTNEMYKEAQRKKEEGEMKKREEEERRKLEEEEKINEDEWIRILNTVINVALGAGLAGAVFGGFTLNSADGGARAALITGAVAVGALSWAGFTSSASLITGAVAMGGGALLSPVIKRGIESIISRIQISVSIKKEK